MKTKRIFADWPWIAAGLIAASLLIPVRESAQNRGSNASNSPSAVLTCADLATNPKGGLAGNPNVVAGSATSVLVPASGPRQITNGMSPDTPSFCQVDLTYSSMSGRENGYNIDQKQLIKIRVVLPLSSVDGGSGNLQGNWNGKVLVSGSPGMSATLTFSAYTEGVTRDDSNYAIRLGYVGTMTDTGQTAGNGSAPAGGAAVPNGPGGASVPTNGAPPDTAQGRGRGGPGGPGRGAPGGPGGGNFGIIQTGPLAHTLNVGAIQDWAARATKYGKDWGKSLAAAYYGLNARRVYYDGCSGGGNMGMGQLQNYGDEYDGFLIGAPAMHWQEFRLADSWPAVVMKKLAQKGKSLTTGQVQAANTAATKDCDKADGLADGIVADPRACTFSAKSNICGRAGAPDSPNCLDVDQAEAIDEVWDGPTNHLGDRIYFPFDRGINFGAGTNVGGSTGQVMKYNHLDTMYDPNLLFADGESLAAANYPQGGVTYEDEAYIGSGTTGPYMENDNPVLDKAKNHGTKVIHLHGTQDGAIRWRHSVEYYRQVARYFDKRKNAATAEYPDYASLQSWYRFYAMPGVGHCGGGDNPSAIDPFLALVDWVEKGTAPDRLFAKGFNPVRTRPLCPYPEFAEYKGGDPNDWNSFQCGGNLEANHVALCQMPRLKIGFEHSDAVDYEGISPADCIRPQRE